MFTINDWVTSGGMSHIKCENQGIIYEQLKLSSIT